MSTLKFDTWKDRNGTRTYAPCTAWVNFNGTGTVAIRDSLNVSSITDDGTGNYTANFTTAMADANYAGLATASRTSQVAEIIASIYTFATGSCAITCNDNASTETDSDFVSLAVFGGI